MREALTAENLDSTTVQHRRLQEKNMILVILPGLHLEASREVFESEGDIGDSFIQNR